MSFLEAVVLGIVQGLTEFLPINSTAHLSIVPALLHWPDPGAAFSAVIQCGTLVAVLAYFRRDILHIAKAWLVELKNRTYWVSLDARLGWMIILGTVPVVVLGLLLKKHIEGTFRSLYVIAGAQIFFALMLLLAELAARMAQKAQVEQKGLEQLSWGDSIAVGLFQAMALIPGASRSGVTIAGGLFRGMNRETAARFSFLLSVPAVFAAAVLELIKERKELLASRDDAINLAACTVVSAVVGYLAIAFLLRYLRTHTTYVFIAYRLVLGVAIFGLLAGGYLAADSGMKKPAIESRPEAKTARPVAAYNE